MRARVIVIGVLCCAYPAAPAVRAAENGDRNAAAAFARLAALAGEWKTADGKESVTYELIAGGSAVLERDLGEGRPPMLTLYHRDGDRLLLTHYCAAGNQPRMVARRFEPSASEVVFDYLDATNLSGESAGHMRHARMRFVDTNHLDSEWHFYENGKLKGSHRARYVRVQ